MRHLVNGLLVASIATLVACGGDDKPVQDPSAMNTPAPPPAPMPESKPATTDSKPVDSAMGGGTNAGSDTTAAKPAEKPLTDGEIVAVTSTANAGEIEMANLAAKTATSADVKNFAAMMITQHKDMETKGKALATKAKITPADNDASTALKTDVQSTITSLKTQKGKDFDKAYMESQVKAHRDVLNLFDNKLLPNAQNSDLKTLLTDGRSHVAAHLAKAEEIQKKLDAAPAAKPAAMPAKK
jgi:putative membrane protein